MEIDKFIDSLKLSKNDTQNVLKKYNLDKEEQIDDYLASLIFKQIKLDKKYDNKSSLKNVEIIGLFDKYNYNIPFEKSINIFVAENGRGKTTIIKIIVAALKDDLVALNKLPFNHVKLMFSNGKKINFHGKYTRKKNIRLNNSKYILKSENINNFELNKQNFELNPKYFEYNNQRFYDQIKKVIYNFRLNHKLSFSQMNVVKNLERRLDINGYIESNDVIRTYQMFRKNLRRSTENIEGRNLEKELDFMKEELFDPLLKITRTSRSRVFDDKQYNFDFNMIEEKNFKEEVIYLPTYRRLEIEFEELTDSEGLIKKQMKKNNLNFGVKDVEEQMNKLTLQLTKEAFETHSKINGEILEDLLSKETIELTEEQKKKITSEKIKIIVGRIGKKNIKESEKLINHVKRLRSNTSEVSGNLDNLKFLNYYLFKLINIYDGQQEIDNRIKKFKNVCNKYLINKTIIYDEISPVIKIVDTDDNNIISFKELSSGEKQILSIFAELYLMEHEKMIYIIDEPELSLSLSWQKKILKDIYDSGKISLLLSTTHSPFIYKNEFENFAQDLNLYRTNFEENSLGEF